MYSAPTRITYFSKTGKQLKQSAKQEVAEMLNHLPDDSTLEDIQYHLYVLEKIKKGQEDLAQGRSYTQEQAKDRLKRWLKQ